MTDKEIDELNTKHSRRNGAVAFLSTIPMYFFSKNWLENQNSILLWMTFGILIFIWINNWHFRNRAKFWMMSAVIVIVGDCASIFLRFPKIVGSDINIYPVALVVGVSVVVLFERIVTD